MSALRQQWDEYKLEPTTFFVSGEILNYCAELDGSPAEYDPGKLYQVTADAIVELT